MISAKEALQRLLEGNQRFFEGNSIKPNHSPERVKEISPKQTPFALVIGCSDSRIVPEIIFDQGLGDLFVVRVAGNTVDNVCVGSIEYAVEHLDIKLIVVLGHSHCGVFAAAMGGDDEHHHLSALVETARSAVIKAKVKEGDLLDNAIKENVRILIDTLKNTKPVLNKVLNSGEVMIQGAFYDLETGKVDLLN